MSTSSTELKKTILELISIISDKYKDTTMPLVESQILTTLGFIVIVIDTNQKHPNNCYNYNGYYDEMFDLVKTYTTISDPTANESSEFLLNCVNITNAVKLTNAHLINITGSTVNYNGSTVTPVSEFANDGTETIRVAKIVSDNSMISTDAQGKLIIKDIGNTKNTVEISANEGVCLGGGLPLTLESSDISAKPITLSNVSNAEENTVQVNTKLGGPVTVITDKIVSNESHTAYANNTFTRLFSTIYDANTKLPDNVLVGYVVACKNFVVAGSVTEQIVMLRAKKDLPRELSDWEIVGFVPEKITSIDFDNNKIVSDGDGGLSVDSLSLSGQLKLGNIKDIPIDEAQDGSLAINDNDQLCRFNKQTNNWETFLLHSSNVSYLSGSPLSSENAELEQVKNAKVGDIIISTYTGEQWEKIKNDDKTTTWQLQLSTLINDCNLPINGVVCFNQRDNKREYPEVTLQKLYDLSSGRMAKTKFDKPTGDLLDLINISNEETLEALSGYTFSLISGEIGKPYFLDNVLGTFTFRVFGEDKPNSGVAIRAKIMCGSENTIGIETYSVQQYKDTTFILRAGDSLKLSSQTIFVKNSEERRGYSSDVCYFAELHRAHTSVSPYVFSEGDQPKTITSKGFLNEIRLGDDGVYLCTKEGEDNDAQWTQYPSFNYLKKEVFSKYDKQTVTYVTDATSENFIEKVKNYSIVNVSMTGEDFDNTTTIDLANNNDIAKGSIINISVDNIPTTETDDYNRFGIQFRLFVPTVDGDTSFSDGETSSKMRQVLIDLCYGDILTIKNIGTVDMFGMTIPLYHAHINRGNQVVPDERLSVENGKICSGTTDYDLGSIYYKKAPFLNFSAWKTLDNRIFTNSPKEELSYETFLSTGGLLELAGNYSMNLLFDAVQHSIWDDEQQDYVKFDTPQIKRIMVIGTECICGHDSVGFNGEFDNSKTFTDPWYFGSRAFRLVPKNINEIALNTKTGIEKLNTKILPGTVGLAKNFFTQNNSVDDGFLTPVVFDSDNVQARSFGAPYIPPEHLENLLKKFSGFPVGAESYDLQNHIPIWYDGSNWSSINSVIELKFIESGDNNRYLTFKNTGKYDFYIGFVDDADDDVDDLNNRSVISVGVGCLRVDGNIESSKDLYTEERLIAKQGVVLTDNSGINSDQLTHGLLSISKNATPTIYNEDDECYHRLPVTTVCVVIKLSSTESDRSPTCDIDYDYPVINGDDLDIQENTICIKNAILKNNNGELDKNNVWSAEIISVVDPEAYKYRLISFETKNKHLGIKVIDTTTGKELIIGDDVIAGFSFRVTNVRL